MSLEGDILVNYSLQGVFEDHRTKIRHFFPRQGLIIYADRLSKTTINGVDVIVTPRAYPDPRINGNVSVTNNNPDDRQREVRFNFPNNSFTLNEFYEVTVEYAVGNVNLTTKYIVYKDNFDGWLTISLAFA